MTDLQDPQGAAAWLRTPQAIRLRCNAVYRAAESNSLNHFVVEPERLAAVADYVVETIRANYPDLAIPYHARWRHFALEGRDRWGELRARLAGLPQDEIARIQIDLVVTSVLLDAGAGASWHYKDPQSKLTVGRSEGLALASLQLFAGGLLSSRPGEPWRADAAALGAVTAESLGAAFQVGPDNPLVALEGRVALLRRLGTALVSAPEFFGSEVPRVGNLYDIFDGFAPNGELPASVILDVVLRALGPIWPGRITLGEINLGDVWRHPAATADDLTDGLVPFHKLSQWLSYSLVEPIEAVGIRVTGLDELTGLPEYRNGGLLLDLGVLRPKHTGVLGEAHEVGSEVIVEWRALTVALLDRLAEPVRERLGVPAVELPLAKILEGGTWSAGRRIARERRPDGGPPIQVVSDGTVF